jgi:muconolactone D-isomerase
MKYLVTMEFVGTPPVASPQEMVQWLERMIIPTEEAMMKLEADKKILAGGDLSGRRGMALILEAASNDELSRILSGIPEWPFLEVDVTPLESFEERLAQVRETLERLKAASK